MSIRSTNPTDYINNNTDSPNRIIHELRNIDRTLQGAEGAIPVTATVVGSPNVFVTNGAGNPVPVSFASGGLATEVTLGQVRDRLNQGQDTMANSLSVTIANDQTTINTLEQSRIVYTTVIDKISYKQYIMRQFHDANGNMTAQDFIDFTTNSTAPINPADVIVDTNANKTMVCTLSTSGDLVNQNDLVVFRDIGGLYNVGVIRFRSDINETATIKLNGWSPVDGNYYNIPFEIVKHVDQNNTYNTALYFNVQGFDRVEAQVIEKPIAGGYSNGTMVVNTINRVVESNTFDPSTKQVDIGKFKNRYSNHIFLTEGQYTNEQILKSLLSFIGSNNDTTIVSELVNINSQLSSGVPTIIIGTPNVTVSGVSTSTNQTNGTQKTQLVDNLGNVFDNLQVGGQDTQMVSQSGTNFVLSTANSTTTQLAGSATFTGVIESIFNQQTISILLTSDKAATLTLRQYIDAAGTRVTNTWVTNIAANVPFSKSFTGNGNFFNLIFVNSGGAATTTLNINTAYGTLFPATNLGNVPVSIDEVNGVTLTVGQKSMTSSIPVVIASDQTVIPVATSQLAVATDANLLSRTTSGNSGTIVDVYGNNIASVINVTAVSGTNPTLDIVLEQSSDNGVTWQAIYHVRRIATIGSITVPSMVLTGRRRWSWTIGGTTPSFTFGITSSKPDTNQPIIRNFFDRTMTSTVGSTSQAFDIEGTKQITFYVNINAAVVTTTQYQLQVTNDIPSGWANIGNVLNTGVLGGLFVSNAIETTAKFARLICTVSGGGSPTVNYININSIS